MNLRLASWNMDHWKRMRDDPTGQSQRTAWAYLQALGVDVALVQEAVLPPYIDPATWPVRSHPAPDQPDAWFIDPRDRRWGSGVVVFNPALEFEPIEATPLGSGAYRRGLRISHPGTWAAIRLLLAGDVRVTLVSAYGVLEDWNHEGKFPYATMSIGRMLSDLTPLIGSADGQRMVTDCLDARLPADRGQLANCPCGPGPGCRHIHTWRHENRPDSRPSQLD